jgi:ABC-type bacteriocin/lantibiotic exporter with double-glycine peptidase domain
LPGQIRAYEYSVNDLIEKKVTKSVTAEDPLVPVHSIELRNISFRYNNLEVLKNFNLSLEKGDFLGITGNRVKEKQQC